jgi:hypothetical protein
LIPALGPNVFFLGRGLLSEARENAEIGGFRNSGPWLRSNGQAQELEDAPLEIGRRRQLVELCIR